MAGNPKLVTPVQTILKNTIITCVKFIDKYLFVGQSGDLICFDVSCMGTIQQPVKISTLTVFPFQNIYGIIPLNFKILVFGGRNVAILTSKHYHDSTLTSSWNAEDWILDGVWCESDSVLLLTAHNTVLEYSTSSKRVVNKVSCVERCILYSGKILGSQWVDLIVFAGTVYQEVGIWAPNITDEDGNIPVLHHLKGHQGVVFSITYDPVLERIASTSDDRTVRVWSVKFPNDGDITGKWANADVNLSFSAFGHTARVWKSSFTSTGNLVTVGEDSHVNLWDKNGVLLNRWEHSGEIRCLDYADESIVLGGNGVAIRYLSAVPDFSNLNISTEFGTPKWVLLSVYGHPITFTEHGFLILKSGKILDKVYEEKLANYCVVSQSLCRRYIALGGILGDLILYKVHKTKISKKIHINVNKERIFSLAWISGGTIVVSGENGLMTQIHTDNLTDEPSMTTVCEHYLPPSKERWLTCSLKIGGFLICGDRMGSLHLYTASNSANPEDSLLKVHGTKGVTDLKEINGVVYSTGRDGTLKETTITQDKPYKLNLVSTLKLPMDWATSIIDSCTYGLLIAGFYDKNFLLWSVEEKITLLTLECGGGHRSFDCMFDELNGNIIISFIRMKCVNYIKHPLYNLVHQTIIAGYHTKPINCACVLSTNQESASILTGGEDNSLNICALSGTQWKGCGTYIRHISALRAVKCVENVVASAGARAQLIVWELFKNLKGEWHLKEIKSHMIRDENEHKRSWRNAEPLVDPETRYMDVEVVKHNEDLFFIFGACSDGMLRAFEYNKASGQLTLKDAIDCEQGCLLRISSFTQSNALQILTAGTQGTVAFHQHPFVSSPLQKHRLHSSGINAMGHVWLRNRLVLVTGGDDSCLVLSVFELNKNRPVLVFNIVERVHTCQVSGVAVTSEYVVSAALDQKLCLFRLSFDGNYLRTTFLGYFITSIPDIHGILFWPKEERDMDIFIFGCGFQLVNFNGTAISS